VLTLKKLTAYYWHKLVLIPIAEIVVSELFEELRQKINRVLDKSLELSGENRMTSPLQGSLYVAAKQVNQALFRR
jgi:hypothetical protein